MAKLIKQKSLAVVRSIGGFMRERSNSDPNRRKKGTALALFLSSIRFYLLFMLMGAYIYPLLMMDVFRTRGIWGHGAVKLRVRRRIDIPPWISDNPRQ